QPSATRPERRLDLAETVDLLQRLGITTLGDLAALPSAAVADRFGPDVATLHLLARGQEPAPPAAHHPTQPLFAETTLETPLVRTDQAAFIARPLAEQLHTMLLERGLVCTRLRIVARTESGEEMERTWRHDGALSVADVVDRIRWQCDGWITRARLGGPATGAITRIGLHPQQLAPAGESAPALWGSAGEAAQRASRAFARAQGLAGEEAVQVPARAGGPRPAEETTPAPWRSEKPEPRGGPGPCGARCPPPRSAGARRCGSGTPRALPSWSPPAACSAPLRPGCWSPPRGSLPCSGPGRPPAPATPCSPTAPPPSWTSAGGPLTAPVPPACSWWCAPRRPRRPPCWRCRGQGSGRWRGSMTDGDTARDGA